MSCWPPTRTGPLRQAPPQVDGAGGRSEEGYGAPVERRGRDNQCATPSREDAALIWTRSANSHSGPRHETRRIRGRTHVSTRRRAAPNTMILLAPKGASTHVARIEAAGAMPPAHSSGRRNTLSEEVAMA